MTAYYNECDRFKAAVMEMKCGRCKHPESWHAPNDLHKRDAEKFNESSNGICSLRRCACCGFVAKAFIEAVMEEKQPNE